MISEDFADTEQPSKVQQTRQLRKKLAAVDHERDIVISKGKTITRNHEVVTHFVGSTKFAVDGKVYTQKEFKKNFYTGTFNSDVEAAIPKTPENENVFKVLKRLEKQEGILTLKYIMTESELNVLERKYRKSLQRKMS